LQRDVADLFAHGANMATGHDQCHYRQRRFG
jgi:hypothetical protein